MQFKRYDFVLRTRSRHAAFFGLCTALFLGSLSCATRAQSSAPTPGTARNLAPVVVTGVLPGPALWKVSKGDHVMWVLGLTSPVPKNMEWKSKEVESKIAASQAVLRSPSLEVGVRTSFFRSGMMPSMAALKMNPAHKTLRDVLAPALYQRWRAQKTKFLYNNETVEYMRPILAGRELFEAALKHFGLVDQTGLEKKVYRMADLDGVTLVTTSYQVMLKDPADTVHALNNTSMNDQQCLSRVLDSLDHDLDQDTARANAWATGDIDTLRSIFSQVQQDACLSTIDTSQFAQALGIHDIEKRVEKSWIDAATHAIDQNRQTVALLPMHELLAPDGYLSVLQADGYTVRAPTE
ncbi:MAG TPA: TraB/GumN family protein [Dyella sp.]|nr:TraB/GumN family protein [Dyella sp.]